MSPFLRQKLNGENDMRFKHLIEEYMHVRARHKKTAKRDQQYLDQALSAFGNKVITKMSRRDAIVWFATRSERTPIAANRALECLRCVFNFAIDLEYLEKNPFARIRRNPEISRERYLSRDEARRLLATLSIEPPVIQTLFKCYLLTGLRKEELLSLTWTDVDLDAGVLHIVNTKNGRGHHIPIPPAVVQMFEQLPKSKHYVFAGRRKNTRVCVDKNWARIKKLAMLKDVRLHDLRRTAGSWLAQDGTDLHSIGQLLNHKSQQSTRVYARLDMRNKLQSTTALQSHLEKLEQLDEEAALAALH